MDCPQCHQALTPAEVSRYHQSTAFLERLERQRARHGPPLQAPRLEELARLSPRDAEHPGEPAPLYPGFFRALCARCIFREALGQSLEGQALAMAHVIQCYARGDGCLASPLMAAAWALALLTLLSEFRFQADDELLRQHLETRAKRHLERCMRDVPPLEWPMVGRETDAICAIVRHQLRVATGQ